MTAVPFTVYLNEADLTCALELMRAIGVSTPDSLLKVALWNQARISLDDVPRDAFALGWVRPSAAVGEARPPQGQDPPDAPGSSPEGLA